jgi:glycerophosphoryl diester phosphodiesterase
MSYGARAATVRRGEGTRPLVIAHRGAWDQAPQNSLAAVQRAVELGCDGVEIDVRRTADGQMVVVHDGRLGWRRVGRLTRGQVRDRMAAGQAPLLDEVLDAAAGRLLVDVELKEGGYVAEAMGVVAERLPADSYVVTSFIAEVLAEVKRAQPETRTGLLVSPRGARLLERRVRAARADFLAPYLSMARSDIAGWAAQRSMACWFWTVNPPAAMRSLAADLRVAALITDAPAEAVRLSHGVDLADSRE